MHIIGYVLVFLSTAYSAISLFGLGWSTEPASFVNQLIKFGVICTVAGAIASLPKKAERMIVLLSAAPFPAVIFVLMTQGIIQSGAFHQVHWVVIPLGIVVFPVISFTVCRKRLAR